MDIPAVSVDVWRNLYQNSLRFQELEVPLTVNGPNMTLLEILATQIPGKLRKESGSLCASGAVKWIDRIPPRITAEVETESFVFTVRLQLKSDEEILYECGCDDYAGRRDFCCHVWALLLAAEPAATCDDVFERARARLRNFEKVDPCDALPGFSGQLRAYQKEGLGWLHFRRDFRFGGCLADDMGLGKTVQVLALLESMRDLREKIEEPERPGPSLVVVPRSLVFNWKAEAARFTPHLHVLDFSSAGRAGEEAFIEDCDLVIATYGTLRADAPVLKKYLFDYVILDEAQTIKNPSTATAKAARLLRGRHRLALSGTPVQNHLADSIIDAHNSLLSGLNVEDLSLLLS
jgi:hypothetical protein